MGMNDFWQGFNTVDNFITNRRKLDLAEQRAARDAAWEDERRGWERQDRQRADQRLELAGQMARIDAGTATPEELEAARTKYLPASKGMQPMGVIGPQATQAPKPTEWDGTKALEGLVQQRTDLVTQALGKLDAAQKAGQPPQLDEREARALVEVPVQSNLFTDDDPGRQHAALQTIEAHLGALGNIPGKAMINDPAVLSAVEIAYPQTVKGSNLKGARVSAVYIDPSPDGDPMKAKITVGIAGKNDKDEDVDGVLTEKRTSDPDDAILQLPAGEWLSMAEGKRRILDGMAAARVALGDEKAWETVQQARKTREVSGMMQQWAQQMPEGNDRNQLLAASHLLILGGDPKDAIALAEKALPKPFKEKLEEALTETREIAKIEAGKQIAIDDARLVNDIKKAEAEARIELKTYSAKLGAELRQYGKKLGMAAAQERIPKEGALAEYLFANGYAKNKEDAWRMANHAKDNPEKLAFELASAQIKAQAENGIVPGADGYRDGKTIARESADMVKNLYAGFNEPAKDVNALLFDGGKGTAQAATPPAKGQPQKPAQRGMAPPQTFAERDAERRKQATEEYNRKMAAARNPATVSYELPSLPRVQNNVEAYNPFTKRMEIVPMDRTAIDPNRKGYNKRIVVPQ